MAGFAAIVLALVSSMRFGTTAQPSCGPAVAAGLVGCECNFLGACDVRGNRMSGLNILNHSPNGLEQYAHARSVVSGGRVTYLCEGNTVAILYDCNNRIPLYAATVVNGNQLSAEDGPRPVGGDATFRESGTALDRRFQQNTNDYWQASQRDIYIKMRSQLRNPIDENWYSKLNPPGSVASNTVHVVMHRGHLIASRYGVGDHEKKKKTFVYTNAVPQFGDFNSGPWKTCEGRLIQWGRVYCLREGTTDVVRNVQMFIIVGAIPSTFNGPSKTRFFGSGGFSNYQDETSYRVNVPSEMWAASCCTYEFTKDRRTYSITRSTAFWRENVPGKEPCKRINVEMLEKKLTPRGGRATTINLFPSSGQCSDGNNYRYLL